MPVVYPVCCGLEVHQAQRTACLPPGGGGRDTSRRRSGSVGHHDERAARPAGRGSWQPHCPVVAMESPGGVLAPVFSRILISREKNIDSGLP